MTEHRDILYVPQYWSVPRTGGPGNGNAGIEIEVTPFKEELQDPGQDQIRWFWVTPVSGHGNMLVPETELRDKRYEDDLNYDDSYMDAIQDESEDVS